MSDDRHRDLVVQLFAAGGVKLEDVVLKTGLISPVYVDLRVLVSHPNLMKEVGELLCRKIGEKGLRFDSVCGVPYTALPIATAVSLRLGAPMLMRRKEAKSYGTKKTIEGSFREQDVVLVVEDVLTSGTSILETVNTLTACKLRVTDAVVLLDRNQNGCHNLQSMNLPHNGIAVHSLFDLKFVTRVLVQEQKITAEAAARVTNWLDRHPSQLSAFCLDQKRIANGESKRLPFEQRRSLCTNKLTSKILDVVCRKGSNLCLAADFTSKDRVLQLADCAGPHIAVLKVHADIITDFSADFVTQLQLVAQRHDFVLFEDRKFADIGHTVSLQYGAGLHKIRDWADLVTCHVTPGDGVVRGLKCGLPEDLVRGCVLIAEMSSAGSLLKQDAVQSAHSMARAHPDFVVGFICQNLITTDPALIHMTPGVSFETGGDSLGQQYLSPEQAIANGADLIIAGRAITGAADPEQAAMRMKERAFHAYQTLCNA